MAGHAALFTGLSRLAAPQPRPDFARRAVLAATAPPLRQKPARRAWLAVATAFASAAAMLLAVSLVWYARHRAPPVLARPTPAPTAIAAGGTRGRGFALTQPALSQRRLSPARMPTVTSADLFLQAPGLPGRLHNYRGAIDDLVTALPEAGYRLEEMEHLAPGLRPLRVSLSMIWETLCRTIPGTQYDSPSTPPRRTSTWWLEPMRVA